MRFPIQIVLAALAAVAPLRVHAISCAAKEIKSKQVCGVVVDSDSGAPVQGATVKVVSSDGHLLSGSVVTNADGQFLLIDAAKQEGFITVTANGRDTLRWPVRITGEHPAHTCKRPLKIHLASESGVSCQSWVATK